MSARDAAGACASTTRWWSSPAPGRNLGREYALLLASRGAKVVVNDLGVAISDTDGSGDAPARNPALDVVEEIRDCGRRRRRRASTASPTPNGGAAIVADRARRVRPGRRARSTTPASCARPRSPSTTPTVCRAGARVADRRSPQRHPARVAGDGGAGRTGASSTCRRVRACGVSPGWRRTRRRRWASSG